MVASPTVLTLFNIKAVIKSINKYPDKLGNREDAKGVKKSLLHLQSDEQSHDLVRSADIKWSIRPWDTEV